MTIGIVIAIARELKAFLESDYRCEVLHDCGREVLKTEVNGNTVYATKSGYGLIDAASSTEFLITRYDCSLIVNFGVVGALAPHMKVDDLLIVNQVCNYDYDVSPIDPVALHQYEEYPTPFMPLTESKIAYVKTIARSKNIMLADAVCASGDRFVETAQDKKERYDFGCNICDMECAAIVRTALFHQAEVLSIKCISDTLEGDGGDFNQNVVKSAAKAFALIQEVLKTL